MTDEGLAVSAVILGMFILAGLVLHAFIHDPKR